MSHGARTHLIHYLSGGYALLVIYASLYPLAGWHDSGIDPLSFAAAAWPRYYTGFDMATNLLAYLPFGFLVAAALRGLFAPLPSWLAAAAIGAGLSFVMELLQNYLPNRVPSNLDLACNSAGALLGAWVGAQWGARALNDERLGQWQHRVMRKAYGVNVGVLLMVAWLVTQLSPETLLFGSGNLRQMLDLPPVQPFLPERFANIEAAIAASGLLAAGLITTLLLRQHARLLTGGLLLAAFLLRMLMHALLAGPGAALAWITPGNAAGIAIGLVLWWSASFLAFAPQRAVASLALLLATVMVNVAPDNPYLLNMSQLWHTGQYLNFNGLTRLVCSLWPFLVLPWLMIYRPEKNDARHY